MIDLHEGPILREYVHPKVRVCNQCKWCKMQKVYGHKTVDILFAMCNHIYAEDYLEHDEKNVLTPDWCPFVNPQTSKSK